MVVYKSCPQMLRKHSAFFAGRRKKNKNNNNTQCRCPDVVREIRRGFSSTVVIHHPGLAAKPPLQSCSSRGDRPATAEHHPLCPWGAVRSLLYHQPTGPGSWGIRFEKQNMFLFYFSISLKVVESNLHQDRPWIQGENISTPEWLFLFPCMHLQKKRGRRGRGWGQGGVRRRGGSRGKKGFCFHLSENNNFL